jgi:hypothetical protein
VLGRQHDVGRAIERVRPGGEDLDLLTGGPAVRSGDAKDGLSALGAANPVALHGQRGFGPIDQRQIFEQAIRVAGDAQKPLAHVLALDALATTFAAALRDLFVGQSGLARWAPVDGNGAFVGQALLVELQEDPLRPLHVAGIRGVDLALPVVGESDRIDLAAEIGDGLFRGHARVNAGLDGVVFRGQTKGVPAHRVQHIEALHALPARDDVGRGVAFAVADVQTGARRIGKHIEGVKLRPLRIERRAMQLGFAPARLPLGFYDAMFVRHESGGSLHDCRVR